MPVTHIGLDKDQRPVDLDWIGESIPHSEMRRTIQKEPYDEKSTNSLKMVIRAKHECILEYHVFPCRAAGSVYLCLDMFIFTHLEIILGDLLE